ncbi:PREDICTED: DNA ligase 1-like isoform X3 [Camelina sativa]|uniref:DNA ligase 1-like isoform X3 n=1 Tax=Camelina sativa TaxID=90675 RepID=A0ABM0TLZ8_CAMSA|nr:PREDICTED: DNA ligase 1-like isoform X3 [Camelina sativa]
MQCYTNEEALASLYINVSASFFLLLLLLYSAVSLLLKLLRFIGGFPLLQRNEDEYDSAAWYTDDEEEEEEEEEEFKMSCNASYHVISRDQNPDLIADIGDDGESLVFYNNSSQDGLNNEYMKEFINVHQTHDHEEEEEEEEEDDQDSHTSSTEEHFSSANVSPYRSESSSIEEEDDGVEDLHDDRYDNDDDDDEDEEVGGVSRYDVVEDLVRKLPNTTSTRGPSRFQSGLVFNDKSYNEVYVSGGIKDDDEIQPASGFDMSEIKAEELEEEEEEERGEIFGESCTNGSTSKSSSEWRNSVKNDDPFSTSSRRSCPKWESYTVFQKYDEEMTFLTRISAQKLHETESLKSIMVEPRSISERIVHKLSSNGHKQKQQQYPGGNGSRPNPYVELESAYVAQICLTWEALSWNYKNFERKRSSTQRSFNDVGCPAGIADQFRTFHILLQRYVENEPYEHGRRPEIYARMRTLAPKLLLVPEYQDYEEEEEKEEEKEECFKSRISSASFLMIMEECIRTFMNFLKADKEKPCQKIIKAFFGRSKCGSVDPTIVHLMKKVNTKKKTKLKEMRKGGKYMRKKKMSIEEEMEVLMGLIDLKVVSRVLRMNEMNEEKLHWCEEKMSKVKMVQGGKALQRDSTPLFFPPH